MKSLPRGKKAIALGGERFSWALPIQAIKHYRKNDPVVVQQFMANTRASISELQKEIVRVSGEELFHYILEDSKKLKRLLFDPDSLAAVMTGVFAANWLNKKNGKMAW